MAGDAPAFGGVRGAGISSLLILFVVGGALLWRVQVPGQGNHPGS